MLKKTLFLTALLIGLGTTVFAQALFIFSPGSLPDGQYGSAYANQTLTVIGGIPPYTFSVSAGSLPPGMSLSPAGVISGTPTAAGSYTFTVTAQDSDPLGPFSGSQPYTLNIDPAPLTITANDATMPYGGTLPALGATYSGFVNGDTVSNLTVQPALNLPANANSPVGSYPITPSGAQDPNYTISYVNGTFTITAVPLTITANNASMTYGGSVPALSASYTGFVNGDNSSSLKTQPTISTTATSTSAAGTYPITATGAVDPNYTITYQAGTMTIGKAPLTVTAQNKTMPLGGPLPALTITYTGFVNGDTTSSLSPAPTATTTATASSPAGTYPITPAGGSSPNYTFTYVSGVLSIGKALLTITANPAGSVYGAALVPGSSLTVSYSGFVNGDGPGNLTTLPTVTNSATAGSPAGAYTLTSSGASDPNYTIAYVNGVYTIHTAPLTIAAVNQTMTYGGTVPALSVTYSGFVNGDNASSLTTSPTVTTTATSSSPAGSYPITASGAVDPNYSVTYVAGTMTVQRAALTLTANSLSMSYGGAVPPLTISYSGFVNGDNASSLNPKPTITTTATSSSPPGGYPITVSGAGDPNYTITYIDGTMTVGGATLTITANSASMTYGGTVPALTVSYSGFVNGDNASSLTTPPVITTSATSSSSTGTYPITPSGAVDPKYTIIYVPGTLTIDPATLHITANGQTKEYGAPDPPLTFTVSGFLNGDNSNIFTGSLSRAPGEDVGTYPITEGNLSAGGNYTITYTGNNLTITKASQQITWTQSLVVGCNSMTQVQLTAATTSSLPITYSVSDPTVATVSGSVLTLLQPGTAVVTAAQAGDSNYDAATPVADTVLYQSASLISEHWNDVIFFDNSSGDYTAWQWYKNDTAVQGDTLQYYSESPSLNGQYFVIATNREGQQVQSCTLTIAAGAAIPGGIKVFPNPANIGEQVTVTCNYSAGALQGAVMQIVDISGKVVQVITNVQPSMQVSMPSAGGIYIVNLLLANGQKVSTNVFVGN
ncbi:MAG TPA: MBG domain-containing protein [Puia sp.]|nr:MBG domain-containing protein [Puia sp.]